MASNSPLEVKDSSRVGLCPHGSKKRLMSIPAFPGRCEIRFRTGELRRVAVSLHRLKLRWLHFATQKNWWQRETFAFPGPELFSVVTCTLSKTNECPPWKGAIFKRKGSSSKNYSSGAFAVSLEARTSVLICEDFARLWYWIMEAMPPPASQDLRTVKDHVWDF